jgi:hypothetical protein
MITYEDIVEKSIQHPARTSSGRVVRFETPIIIISIVGGSPGLYGDFDNDFEIAIIDKKTGKFMSGFFYPEYVDSTRDVMPYVSRENMLKIVNQLIK